MQIYNMICHSVRIEYRMASPQWFNTDWIGRLKWHSLLQCKWEIDYFCLVLEKSSKICVGSPLFSSSHPKRHVYLLKKIHAWQPLIHQEIPPSLQTIQIRFLAQCHDHWDLRTVLEVKGLCPEINMMTVITEMMPMVILIAMVARMMFLSGGEDWCKLLKISNIISWHWWDPNKKPSDNPILIWSFMNPKHTNISSNQHQQQTRLLTAATTKELTFLGVWHVLDYSNFPFKNIQKGSKNWNCVYIHIICDV